MRCIGVSSELGSIRQEGSLHDYIDRFECLASSVSYTSERYLPGIFINGLRYELQSEVRDDLKHLRVIDLNGVKKLALEAEERLAELDRLAELRKRRMISSRKTERSRVSNEFAHQSLVGGLNRVVEDPWKKFDSMWEKMRGMIKGSKSNSGTHIEVVPSLQEASIGPRPLVESNGKKSENLPNGRSGKFKPLPTIDFQFRRDKGLCHREKVEHIGDVGLIPEGESIGKSGVVMDEKRNEQVGAVELVIANEDDPTLDVIAHSNLQQQGENKEVSIKVECDETKSTEVDAVEYVAIEDDDRPPQAKKLEVLVAYFLDFVGGSVVFESVLQGITLDSSHSAEFVGYLEEAWDFIRTMSFKPRISFATIVISVFSR